MPPVVSLRPSGSVHLEDAMSAIANNKSEPPATLATPVEQASSGNTVALSFAFDLVTRSLNIVMTDQSSGEVVRKIAYTRLPNDVHRTDKLHGLLLDQFA
jgi:uncharacterized FlaG/YvyC family protein